MRDEGSNTKRTAFQHAPYSRIAKRPQAPAIKTDACGLFFFLEGGGDVEEPFTTPSKNFFL